MIELHPVKVRTGSCDVTGRLVFDDGHLVAVLVRLDDPVHTQKVGHWNLEASMEGLPRTAEPFSTLDDAVSWIGHKLSPPHVRRS